MLVTHSAITHAQEAPLLSDSAIRGTLLYRVSGGLSHSGRGKLGPPGVLGDFDVTLTIKNVGSATVQTAVNGCPVRMRGYTAPSRTGPPAYSEVSMWQHCNQRTQVFSLDGGYSKVFVSSVDGVNIAGGRKPLGPWYFVAEIHLPDTVLELRAGEATFDPGIAHLTYRTRTTLTGVAPTSLMTTVTVSNKGADTVNLEYGSCSVDLHAFRSPTKKGKPVWQYHLRGPPPRVGSGYACTLELRLATLRPGDSLNLSASAPTYEILADSLPEARYYFTAELYLNWRTIDLDAGFADLTRKQDPPPSSRFINGIEYSAYLKRTHHTSTPDSLELVVTIKNVSQNKRRLKQMNSADPIYLRAFSDRQARDTHYLGNPSLWQKPVLQIPEFVLSPGESRVLRGTTEAPLIRLYYLAFSWMYDDLDKDHYTFVDLGVDER